MTDQHLSPADLATLRERANDATPGPWKWGPASDSPMTREERATWLTEALRDGEHDIYAAWVPDEDGHTTLPAVTGDGPTSEANAAYIAAANPATILTLLDQLERAEAALKAARTVHATLAQMRDDSEGAYGTLSASRVGLELDALDATLNRPSTGSRQRLRLPLVIHRPLCS